MKIKKHIRHFTIRQEGSKNAWTSTEGENTRLDAEMHHFQRQYEHSRGKSARYFGHGLERGAWHELGKHRKYHPAFEFFNLLDDDKLEVATYRMTKAYSDAHPQNRKYAEQSGWTVTRS